MSSTRAHTVLLTNSLNIFKTYQTFVVDKKRTEFYRNSSKTIRKLPLRKIISFDRVTKFQYSTKRYHFDWKSDWFLVFTEISKSNSNEPYGYYFVCTNFISELLFVRVSWRKTVLKSVMYINKCSRLTSCTWNLETSLEIKTVIKLHTWSYTCGTI